VSGVDLWVKLVPEAEICEQALLIDFVIYREVKYKQPGSWLSWRLLNLYFACCFFFKCNDQIWN